MATPDNREISVLVADDDEAQRLLIETVLKQVGWADHRVTTVPDGRAALRALREQVFDVALLDLSMPELDGLEVFEAIGEDPHRPQVIFVTGQGTVESATKAMKLGAYDFVEKPVDGQRLAALVWKAAQTQDVIARSERFTEVATREASHFHIVTQDERMLETLRMVERVADSDLAVLVHGESGTGKELIAREVHRLSGRSKEPLVALNCAAVAESLAESELFGHEKGAFTGAASRKIGLIELADGGTLFLDEIGDLAPPLQAKLLRVLETKRFRRVGGVKEFPTDFRLVSATNRPLKKLVEREEFRGDLYYRINAVVVDLPPLRERVADLPGLVGHFLEEFRPGEGARWTLDEAAAGLLERYPWPGNVRELRNVIERASLLARGRTIRASDLSPMLVETTGRGDEDERAVEAGGGDGSNRASGNGVGGGAGGSPLPSLRLEELERLAIEEALERTSWHQGQAADLLGVSSRTLHRKIKGYGLRRP